MLNDMDNMHVNDCGNPGESVVTGAADAATSSQTDQFVSVDNAHDQSRPPSAQPPRQIDSDRAINKSVTVTIDDFDLPKSVHPESKTYRLRLSGKGAIKVNQMDLCVAMAANNILSLEEWDDHVLFYRLADLPFERFIHLTPEVNIELRHNASFSFQPATQDDPSIEIECTIEDMTVKETTIFLQYVPVTFHESTVLDILKKSGLQVISMKRDLKEADRWIISVKNEKKEIPHYINLKKLSKREDEKSPTILVTIPGRLTECSVRGCRSTSHRANKCPLLNKDINQKPPEQHPRQTYASAAKGWKNRAKAVQLLEKEKTQPKASDHEWQMVDRRRKQHCHNIRQNPNELRLANPFILLDVDDSDSDDHNDDDKANNISVQDDVVAPLLTSTPISPPKEGRLQRRAKSMAKLMNSVLIAAQKKSNKRVKNTKPAGQADGGKAGPCPNSNKMNKSKRKKRKIQHSGSSGEPHQGLSDDDWESIVSQEEHLDTPDDTPMPDPVTAPEPQPDLTSDGARGQGPGDGEPDPGTSGLQPEQQPTNVQNSIFVHHDSSHSFNL